MAKNIFSSCAKITGVDLLLVSMLRWSNIRPCVAFGRGTQPNPPDTLFPPASPTALVFTVPASCRSSRVSLFRSELSEQFEQAQRVYGQTLRWPFRRTLTLSWIQHLKHIGLFFKTKESEEIIRILGHSVETILVKERVIWMHETLDVHKRERDWIGWLAGLLYMSNIAPYN